MFNGPPHHCMGHENVEISAKTEVSIIVLKLHTVKIVMQSDVVKYFPILPVFLGSVVNNVFGWHNLL